MWTGVSKLLLNSVVSSSWVRTTVNKFTGDHVNKTMNVKAFLFYTEQNSLYLSKCLFQYILEIQYPPKHKTAHTSYWSIRAGLRKDRRLGGVTNRSLLLKVMEARISRSKCQLAPFLGRVLLTCRRPPSRCVFTWQRQRTEALWCPFLWGP